MPSLKFLVFFVLSVVSVLLITKWIFPKSTVSPEVPVVKSPAGEINGELTYSRRSKRKISSYRSIPYAKTPIGELRFKKPELLLENAWSGVRDGSQR